MKKLLAAAIYVSISTFVGTTAYAGCDFFEHNDRQGAKLALQDGECAVLSRNNPNGCEGLKVRIVEGRNDKISSVTLNDDSTAVLKEHDMGEGEQLVVKGNRGVASLGAFNDKASVVLCRQ